MTVLIAQHTKEKIILGADSGGFYNSGFKINLNNQCRLKKINVVNGITYSAAGSASELINFGLFCQIRKPERNDQLGMQKFFVDFNKWLKDQNITTNQVIENSYFIVFENKLFQYNSGAIDEILEDDFATSGAGFREAYMAMHLGKTVQEAIDLTIEMNMWASGEAQIVEILKK
jgi:ATP-dependent protease HslVU (ClpYQ) peptidase subunit